MNLDQIMSYKVFCVIGKTLDEEKYAYKIKHALLEKGFTVYSAPYESSVNDHSNIDIINLCVHPTKGIDILKNISVDYKAILIQPGAESDEIIDYLKDNKITFLKGCSLIGLKKLSKI